MSGVGETQLRSDVAVDYTGNIPVAGKFLIGGILDGETTPRATLRSSGAFTYAASANTRIDADRLIVEAGGDIAIRSDAGIMYVGGSLTTQTGHSIDILAGGSIELGSMTLTAPGGGVNLTAQNSGRVVLGYTGLLTADSVTATASGRIQLSTNVNTLQAHLTGEGEVFVQETDSVELTAVSAANGTVAATAGGTLTATDVVAGGNVILTSLTGDVVIGSVQTNTTSGVIHGGAFLGAIRASASNFRLTGASANLRAGDQQISASQSGVTLTGGVTGNLDPTLILGDVVLNDSLMTQLGAGATTDLVLNATGSVTIDPLSTLPRSLQVGAWRDLTVQGAIPTGGAVQLSALRELRVANGRVLATNQNLSLSAGGNILQVDEGL